MDSPIDGVVVVPLQRIADDRGCVFHMLKSTDAHFVGFGEVYFSSVYPGIVKGWKRHRRATANYACIFGRVRVALYDDRAASRTRGNVMEVVLGPDEYSLVVIPPGIWHGFQGVCHPAAVLANCASEPNDPSEIDRLESATDGIPYEWREFK